METYSDAPQVLRNFLSYHETVKGQSRRTVSEYYLDLRMFLRFVRLMREELPYKTPLDDIPIKDLGLDFIRSITTSDVFDFLSAKIRKLLPETPASAPPRAPESSRPLRRFTTI